MKVYLNSPFARKLLGSFLIVLFLIITASLLLNYFSVNLVQREITISYQKSFDLLASQLETKFDNIESIAQTLLADDDINSVNQGLDNSLVLWDYNKILKELSFLTITNKFDNNISLYLHNKHHVISSLYGISTINENHSPERSTPTGWSFSDELENERSRVLSFSQSNGTNPNNGVRVKVDVTVDSIKSIMSTLQSEDGGMTFLYSLNSKQLIHPDTQYSFNDLELMHYIQLNEDQSGFTFYHNGKIYRVFLYRLTSGGLLIGMILPEGKIIEPILNIRRFLYILLFFGLCLGGLFCLYSFQNFLLPLQKLTAAMKQVEMGNLQVEINKTPYYEWKIIFNQFNQMVRQIDRLINENYVSKLKQQQAQLKLLQSQINPHFLYNCLNFIYQMSMGEDHHSTAKMALYLGKYFRFATRSNRDVITLQEEIENILAYVEIQRMRFPDKVTFQLNIPQEMMHFQIPRLSIQPIIENAFVHGIEEDETEDPKIITVKASRVGDVVKITVENDGKSVSAEKLSEIRESLTLLNTKDSGYGLSNTNWRLKLQFGEPFGISINSKSPRGLIVDLTIPGNGSHE